VGRQTGDTAPSSQARYDALVERELQQPEVTFGRMMSGQVLSIRGKIYAMLVRDQLVVKIPAAQAAELIAAGTAVAFQPRPGRQMREWVAVDPPPPGAGDGIWPDLVDDARRYGLSTRR
jgi:hypothetical protein